MSIESDEERSTRYEGYSDFNVVSRNVANAVDNAVDSYAQIQSLHCEGKNVKPELAAEGSAHILGAALRLLPELKADSESVEKYEQMLEDWDGDDGYIERLKGTSLISSSPDWLGDFVVDIRAAAWHLGYLKAGRSVEQELEDPVERDVEKLFE